ncbi:MAG: leucine-rich repeat domain-containing protein, partial [Cellulosilyticaceae bacterium]
MRKDFVKVVAGTLSVGLFLGALPIQGYGSENGKIGYESIKQDEVAQIPIENTTTSSAIEIANVTNFREGDFSYKVISAEEKTVEIERYWKEREYTGELNIPKQVNYNGDVYTVTSIGYGVFYGYSQLTGDLIIPEGITTIGDRAFRMCSGLTGRLVIPNSVTIIGLEAFDLCTGLTGDLIIPEGVTTIGAAAFSRCSSLQGRLVIPDSVTSIGVGAFADCSGLTGDLIIPDSITNIEVSSFAGCSGLTGKLVIPNSVISIEDNAFAWCTGLTGDLILPESIAHIKSNAFIECRGLVGELIIPYNDVITIDKDAFIYGVDFNSIGLNYGDGDLQNVG